MRIQHQHQQQQQQQTMKKISLIPYTCSTCRTTCGQYPSGIGREVEEGGEASFGFCCIQDSTGRVGHGGTNGGGGGAVSSNTRKSRMRLLYHTTYCNISVECNNREFNYSTITLQHLLGTLSYHLSQHLPKGTIPQPHYLCFLLFLKVGISAYL